MPNYGVSSEIPSWLLEGCTGEVRKPRSGTHFLRKTIRSISGILENDLYCEIYAAQKNFLQLVDPRAKLCVFMAFAVFAGFVASPAVLTVLAAVPVLYAGMSGLPVRAFAKRVWLVVPLAAFLISLPGASSLLIQGSPLFYLVHPGLFGLRDGLYFSAAGLLTVFRLALRAGISLSFAFLLLLTTRWSKIIAGLAAMKLPAMVAAVLNMAYRYLFLLSELAQGMMEARYLRTAGGLAPADSRRFMAHSAAHLFLKGHAVSGEVYEAMRCRGYTGEAASASGLGWNRRDLAFVLLNGVIMILLTAGEHLT